MSSAITAAAVTVGGSYLLNQSANKASNKAANASANASNLEAQIAQDQWDRYKTIYGPMEQQYATDAANYDSPAQYAKAAAEAGSTVQQQFDNARAQLERTPGLDPSSPAFAAGMTDLSLGQAANMATAQNQARQQVKDTAFSRQTSALGLGRGLDSTAAAGASNAASAGLNLARYNNGVATQGATALGTVANQVIGGVKNWLNTPTPTPAPPATPVIADQIA